MGEEGHEQYMTMLNLGWQLSEANGFQGNVSSFDGICRVWK